MRAGLLVIIGLRLRHFIQPQSMLVVSAAALLAATEGTRAAEPAVAVAVRDDLIEIAQDGQERLTYRSTPHPNKPYLQSWRSPAGLEVLCDDSTGHGHHHGLMFAFGVDETNFWHEDDRRSVIGASVQPRFVGKQLPRPTRDVAKSEKRDTQPALAIDQILDWTGAGNRPLVSEHRRIYVHSAMDGKPVSLLTWRSDLQPAEGRTIVSLWGAHYYGLGMRMAHPFDGRGEFRSAEARPPVHVRDDERMLAGRWCAYTVAGDERPVTLVMFDHPQNAKAAAWFAMAKPFAYLSATLSIDRQAYELRAGDTLQLCYGLAVADRPLPDAEIEKLYDRWLKETHRE